MERQKVYWGKAFFWGAVTALLYILLFTYSGFILHMAYTTPTACMVGQDAAAIYYHKATLEACAAKGGVMVEGTWWHVLVPIAFAFAISFAHGAFTGLFWELMGLKAAPAKKEK